MPAIIMRGNPNPDERDGYHGGEHDWVSACDHSPRCVPARPAVEASAAKSYDPPPSHYATDAGFDTWAIWDAYDLDRYTAPAVKYLLRAGKKDIAPRLDDLKKARNYINKAIEMEEGRNGHPR